MNSAFIVGLFVFFFGLIIGSFLNVVLWRLHRHESLAWPRSYCPKCRKEIPWYDNIPVLSFVILGGHCRRCKKSISWQYPIIELATGVIFLLLYFKFGISSDFFINLLISIFLLLIFVHDLKYYLILDQVIYPAMVIAFLGSAYLGLGFINIVVGAIVGSGFFLIQFVVSKGKWIGDGDIGLGFLMGLILGWKMLLVALFLAYMLGAIVGITLIMTGRKEMSSRIPFGPFLTLATLLTILYGSNILAWYINLTFYS